MTVFHRDTGKPQSGYGSVLPHHNEEHNKYHLETTYGTDYHSHFPGCTLDANVSNSDSKFHSDCLWCGFSQIPISCLCRGRRWQGKRMDKTWQTILWLIKDASPSSRIHVDTGDRGVILGKMRVAFITIVTTKWTAQCTNPPIHSNQWWTCDGFYPNKNCLCIHV